MGQLWQNESKVIVLKRKDERFRKIMKTKVMRCLDRIKNSLGLKGGKEKKINNRYRIQKKNQTYLNLWKI